MSNDTISSFVRTLHVLQLSRKRHGGKVESQDVRSLKKLSRKFERIISCNCHHFNVGVGECVYYELFQGPLLVSSQ